MTAEKAIEILSGFGIINRYRAENAMTRYIDE